MFIIIALVHTVSIETYTRFHAPTRQFMPTVISIFIGTIHIADIATAEHVAITSEKLFLRTYLATMNMH